MPKLMCYNVWYLLVDSGFPMGGHFGLGAPFYSGGSAIWGWRERHLGPGEAPFGAGGDAFGAGGGANSLV